MSHPTLTQVRFPTTLHAALAARDWSTVKTWVAENPHLHTVALAAELLNWAAVRHTPAALPAVWAMAPQALDGQERFWRLATPNAMRFALMQEPLLQAWARRVRARGG